MTASAISVRLANCCATTISRMLRTVLARVSGSLLFQ